jgi:aerobic carbon-monoxide dehydrogenase medium subunit
MKPPALRVLRPGSLEACLALLARADETGTKVIAGGGSLMPLMALRMSTPKVLIDIGRLDELVALDLTPEGVRIGARVRHHQLAGSEIAAVLPVLAEAAASIGHVAIRNRGTLGGSLAHADPAAELPAIMVLLGASIECRSQERGFRLVPAGDFLLGPYGTQLAGDELITGVRMPRLPHATGHGFAEFAPRHGDYARAGAACLLSADEQGQVRSLRGVAFAVAATPVDLTPALGAAAGRLLAGIDWSRLAEEAIATVPLVDGAEQAAHRRLACVALRRSLEQAAARAMERSR